MIVWLAGGHDLARWTMCGAVVLSAHAAAAAILANWSDPILPAEPAGAIVVELAPLTQGPAVPENDIAPGPRQVEAAASRERLDEKRDEQQVERDVTQSVPNTQPSAVALPVQQTSKPRRNQLAAPATSAPHPATRTAALAAAPAFGRPASTSALPSWKGQVVALLERHKRYPAEAQSRHEQGTAQLFFSIDRGGRLLLSRIARSSGSSALDQETLALVRRAQPFPPPPAEIAGSHVDMVVPIRFNIR